MKSRSFLATGVALVCVVLGACGSDSKDKTSAQESASSGNISPPASVPGSGSRPRIGVVEISEVEGYPTILKAGYEAKAKEMGADVSFCVHLFDPSKTVTCAENLLSGGAQALIVAPADEGSFQAVVRLAAEKGVSVINDGSPQGVGDDFIPFTGTDNLEGGKLAGRWAAKWIQDNLGGSATIAELTLPAFTDCVKRNEGFIAGVRETIPDAKVVASADGKGQRAPSLAAMENMLQAQPGIDVVFACNDEAAMAAVSALEAAGKAVDKTLVLGFDGVPMAFQAIKEGSMLRLDIVQRPDCYSRRAMENAIKLVRGEVTKEELVADGMYLVKTPVVTAENADAWLKWDGTPETAPLQCERSNG